MTPEDILSHPARVLTPEQRHYYFDHGYVVVEGAIGGSIDCAPPPPRWWNAPAP